jgi:TrmH family RNA methyltransferase
MEITSRQNERLKAIKKLARRRVRDQTGRFVAEGEDLVAAADEAGWTPLERYCASGTGLNGIEVLPELLDEISGLGSGTRTLAVYEERYIERAVGPLCIAVWGVHDPGNIGTILRSALAFGASSVAIGPASADPFGPKAVRGSMGAIFKVPVTRLDRVEDLPGMKVALVAHQGEPLAKVDLTGEISLVLGSERTGLPSETLDACDVKAHIPIAGDSLNAAMAGTVALYLARRVSD